MTGPTQPPLYESEINLQHFLLILRRRSPYLTAIFFFTILFTGVYSYRLTPLYQGSALLIFESNKQTSVDFASVKLGKADEFIQTQKRIITSHEVIGRVLDALHSHKPSRQEKQDDHFPGIGEFSKKVSVHLLRDTNLMQLKVTDPDPEKAALYTNTLAKIYIEYALEGIKASSGDAFIWLSEQVSILKTKLKKSEMDLLKYQQEEELTSIEKKQSSLDDNIAELNDKLSELAMQRIEKESILLEIRGSSGKLQDKQDIPEVLETSQIKFLKNEYNRVEIEFARISTKFKQNHPERIRLNAQLSFIKEKISAETKKVIKDLEIEYRLLQTKENAVKSSLQSFKKQARKLAEQAIEYGVLKREAESNKQLYSVLLERLKKTDIGNSVTSININILESAEIPKSPFTPDIPRNLLLGGVLGLFLGTGSCFLLEYFDNTVKDQHDLELFIGLDLIGTIPERKDAISLGGKMDKQVAGGYQESKIMLDFYRKKHLLKTFMITSTLPNEGKTSTVIGLGMSYAQAGKKVLMVDSDFLDPQLNIILGLPDKSGLFDYFYKEVIPSELATPTSQKNLFLLSAGLLPPNPVDLLTSEKMGQLLQILVGAFDLILIDTPPITSSNGVAVLASYFDGIVFIVRAGSTSYHASKNALKALKKVNVNPIGAVLTRTRE